MQSMLRFEQSVLWSRMVALALLCLGGLVACNPAQDPTDQSESSGEIRRSHFWTTGPPEQVTAEEHFQHAEELLQTMRSHWSPGESGLKESFAVRQALGRGIELSLAADPATEGTRITMTITNRSPSPIMIPIALARGYGAFGWEPGAASCPGWRAFGLTPSTTTFFLGNVHRGCYTFGQAAGTDVVVFQLPADHALVLTSTLPLEFVECSASDSMHAVFSVEWHRMDPFFVGSKRSLTIESPMRPRLYTEDAPIALINDESIVWASAVAEVVPDACVRLLDQDMLAAVRQHSAAPDPTSLEVESRRVLGRRCGMSASMTATGDGAFFPSFPLDQCPAQVGDAIPPLLDAVVPLELDRAP